MIFADWTVAIQFYKNNQYNFSATAWYLFRLDLGMLGFWLPLLDKNLVSIFQDFLRVFAFLINYVGMRTCQFPYWKKKKNEFRYSDIAITMQLSDMHEDACCLLIDRRKLISRIKAMKLRKQSKRENGWDLTASNLSLVPNKINSTAYC